MFTMARIKKTKSSNIHLKKKAVKQESISSLNFVMAVLWGTAGVLISTLVFTVYAAILFIDHANKLEMARMFYKNISTLGEVVYRNDKISYRPDEMINLDIINNSNESIYLAPCQYFNDFEKKISDKWQAVTLNACSDVEAAMDPTSIEKISKKAEESVLAKNLGEGVWRGVSVVYFGCQKAQAESCVNNQKIYTNEFTIGEPVYASNPDAEPQL